MGGFLIDQVNNMNSYYTGEDTMNRFARKVNAVLRAVVSTAIIVGVSLSTVTAQGQTELVWVENGRSLAPIVIPAGTDATIRASADDLASYVEKISGVRPTILEGVPEPLPKSAVWVGFQPSLEGLFPNIDFTFTQPEEILIAANAQHLAIVGRDREPFTIKPPLTYKPTQVGEFGTANAVSTFIHDRLGVRWLWPGELGTDIPHQARIAFEPFTFRFHPPIQSRRFRLSAEYGRTDRGADVAAVNYFWENGHRLNSRSSHMLPRDHAYNDWSDRYREAHPEYFALQPDGTRGKGRDVKLCVSNPAVAEQWLNNMQEALKESPMVKSLGATPNDGGGWCVCENCRAIDHPDAPRGVITERYVKYWNSLARGLRKRMPESRVFLDMLAYGAYKAAPIETQLEDGIAVTFVGHYPLSNEAEWDKTKTDMRGWKAAGAKSIGYRPNMNWYDGGFWGMPSVAMAKTHALFEMLAEMNCHVLEIDSVLMFSSTQGPQHYLMARLTYDPSADGRAILRDFYTRGFGPAADDVQAYYELLEAAHAELVDNPAWRISSSARIEHLELLRRIHTPERLEQARVVLERARKSAEAQGVDPVYAERVTFVRAGLEFTALNMEAAGYMERVRRSKGGDREAVKRAQEICATRDKLLADAPPFAIDVQYFQNSMVKTNSSSSRRMGDYIGPPSPQFIEAEAAVAAEAPRKLAVVHLWKEYFKDDFTRETLGDAWEVVSGAWAIRDGLLVASGDRGDNILLLASPMPGLQRIEFVAASTPPDWEKNPEGATLAICDLTALMHTSSEKPLEGYTVQFGSAFNTINAVRRQRALVVADRTIKVEPGRFYTIVAEFDGQHVRLSIDGKTVLEYEEKDPLLGPSHDRIGIYSYTPMQVKSVRVFTAEARASEFHDDPNAD